MIAELIFVGTELLLGDIVNTNAQYISKGLADLGVSIYYQTTVGDNEERLLGCLEQARGRADVVLLSGGLGPTPDDITKETVAKHAGRKMHFDPKAMEVIENYFNKRKITRRISNDKQACLPEGAILWDNPNGTAPGMCLETPDLVYMTIPGPPVEMKLMFDAYVKPYFEGHSKHTIASKTLKLLGIGESVAAEMLKDLMETSENPTLAPYAKTAEVHLRMTAKAETRQEAFSLIEAFEKKVKEKVGQYIYCEDDRELVDVIIDMLRIKGRMISTAESCTGGLLSSAFIDKPGVSDVYKNGWIVYSNEAKQTQLGVPKDLLDTVGAVSRETAQAMARSAAALSGANAAVSITGIAGPGGGTDLKPVGLVYIGVHVDGRESVAEYHLPGNRSKVRENAVKYALIELLDILKQS